MYIPIPHSAILPCSILPFHGTNLSIELPPGPVSDLHPHCHVALNDVGSRVQYLQLLEPFPAEVTTATGLEQNHGGVCVGLDALVQLGEYSGAEEDLAAAQFVRV